MTIAPHICRTLHLTASQERVTLQALARDFTMRETTRVKGSDMTQSSAIPLLCSSEIPERAVNKGLCLPDCTANAPQGDL